MFAIKPEDDAILDFRRPYSFLSNFSRGELFVDGESCATVEHAYQMQKTLDPAARESIRLKGDPKWAKQSASTKSFPLRDGWSEMSLGVMRSLLEQKFTCHSKLAAQLLATGDKIIAEGNTWDDRRWGVCQDEDGVWRGENLLGVLLMEVRTKLRSGELVVRQNEVEKTT